VTGAPPPWFGKRSDVPARLPDHRVGAQGGTHVHRSTEAGAGNATGSDVAREAHGTSLTNLGADHHDGTPNTGRTMRHVTRVTRRTKVDGESTHGIVAKGKTTDEFTW
jgi:hypothetical protein